jgi:hypothetical protein
MKKEANNVLRPFTRCDWEAFNGCEAEFPEICYGPDWTVLLDGANVGGELDGPNGTERIFLTEYSSPEAARAVADALLSGDAWLLIPEILTEL